MDFIIEFFIEIYVALMTLIIPKEDLNKKHITIAKALAVAVLIAVIALFVWGLVLIVEFKACLGIIPLSSALLISIAQIVAGIIIYNKNHTK